MDIRPINCSKCYIPLGQEMFNRSDFSNCPACNSPLLIRTFPALQNNFSPPVTENVSLDAEASCFFHAQNKAVTTCATCGRFLCSLCDIEFEGTHICAACLDAGKKKKKIKNLETHRVLYDGIALSLSILPIIFFWVTIITAPISIYIAVKHWKAPTSILKRTKIRFIFAIVISSLQIAGWVYFFSVFPK